MRSLEGGTLMEAVTRNDSGFALEWIGVAVLLLTLWLLIGKDENVRPAVPLSEQSVLERLPHGPRVSALVSKDARDIPRLVSRLDDSVRTLCDVFRHGLQLSSDGPCLGMKIDYQYSWLSYSEVLSKAKSFGVGLMALGLDPTPRSRLGIYAVNCPEWIIAEQAAYMFSMSIVPICDSYSSQMLTNILNDADITVMVCDYEVRCDSLLENMPIPLKTIIIMNQPSWALSEKAEQTNIGLLTFEDIIRLGRKGQYERPPNPEDPCTICYTSGTTGDPKGVVLTHKNMVASIVGATVHLDEYKPCRTDILMSFLPLTQIQERIAEYCIFMAGGSVGFYGGDITKLKNDMRLLRPTVVTAVPRVINTLYNKAMDEAKSNWFKKMLLLAGLNAKHDELKRSIIRKDNFWDYIVFRRFQRELGDRIRLVVIGSAPVRPEVLTFLRCALGCAVVEGYGQSECAAGISMTIVGDHVPGHVGPPLPSCSIKLVDVPDMDCFAAKDRGEICVKGPSVFTSYLHERGSSTIDSDGWHHTGDIGQWLSNGTLKIIERKIDTFKLSHGHFISPMKLEEAYMKSQYVHQICIYGDSLKSNLVAIVVPEEKVVKFWAKENEMENTPMNLIYRNPYLKMKIMDSLHTCGKIVGLKPVEFIKDIIIYPEPFSEANGLLTPSKKTRRFKVIEQFKVQIKEMYEQFRL